MLSPVARGPPAVAASSALVLDRSAQACVGMACRNNLKKDKRIRNRVNAFRFKKAPSGALLLRAAAARFCCFSFCCCFPSLLPQRGPPLHGGLRLAA